MDPDVSDRIFLSSPDVGEDERADLKGIAHRVCSDLAPLAARRGAEIEIKEG